MKDCAKIKELLPDYAYGETGKDDTAFIQAHIAKCGECLAELDKIKKIAQAASGLKAELPQHMWDMHLKGIISRLDEPVKKGFALPAWLNVRVLAAGFAVFMMLVAGTFTYFGYFKKALPVKGTETEMAESLDMFENMEIIERLEFYKTMTEKLCEKEPC